LQLFGRCSLLIKNPDQDLSDLIDDCERFVLRSFDGVKQSAMHIYHSALPWTPTSSPTKQLYKRELVTETKLANAVSPTWDACIRIIPVGKGVNAVVFSPSGALIATHGKFCVKVFDAMTGVNRATFDGHKSIYSVAFSPDDGFLVSGPGVWGGTINVWDVQTGMMFRTFKWNILRSSACLVAFSSCGTMISSGGSDGTVRIWNILSGGCDCVFRGHLGAVTDVCWLATQNQVVSGSDDRTVRIWDVRKQTCSKIFDQYHSVTAVTFSRGLLSVASTDGTVNIYDSQSGNMIHTIRSNDMTHSRISVDGGKVLVASRNSGDIWDITTNTLARVGSIEYNGEQATFSPDGTRIASIYGKYVKIWKTNAGYNHHKTSTHVHDTIDNVYISPDERLVTTKSEKGADILDVTTSQSLFTYPVTDFLSIGISLDLSFVAFLKRNGTVHIWNTHTRLHKSIDVDDNVFYVTLSPDGSQLASLSSSHMKLWHLKRSRCLAHLEFDRCLQAKAQISFATNGTGVSLLKNSGGTQSWRISPNHNIDLTRNSIKNSDGTKSRLVSAHCSNGGTTKLPIVFVPIIEERSNWDTSVPCQSYHYKADSEWILDQNGRRVLWIPPDERPQRIWKHGKVMAIQTESKKVYFVKFLQS
jgi:WD40 repeat protein